MLCVGRRGCVYAGLGCIKYVTEFDTHSINPGNCVNASIAATACCVLQGPAGEEDNGDNAARFSCRACYCL